MAVQARYRLFENEIESASVFLAGLGLSMRRSRNVRVFRGRGISISIYDTGTVMAICSDPLMGKLLTDYFETLPTDYTRYMAGILNLPLPQHWIGTDEAGKGDYFGPLVVAGVCMDTGIAGRLFRAGVADSKRFSAVQLRDFEQRIRETLGHSAYEILTISPGRYNTLHAEMGSVSEMLLWAHARVIRILADRKGAGVALVDKFASGTQEGRMASSVRGVRIHQFVRGESEMAIAAASVLAASQFDRSLASLSDEVGIRLPKGAGLSVQSLATAIRRERGEGFYARIAKADFTLDLP